MATAVAASTVSIFTMDLMCVLHTHVVFYYTLQ